MKSISLPVPYLQYTQIPDKRNGLRARIKPYTSKLQMILMFPASSGLHNSRMFPLEMTNSSTLGELKLPKRMTGSDLNSTVDGTLNSCRLV